MWVLLWDTNGRDKEQDGVEESETVHISYNGATHSAPLLICSYTGPNMKDKNTWAGSFFFGHTGPGLCYDLRPFFFCEKEVKKRKKCLALLDAGFQKLIVK